MLYKTSKFFLTFQNFSTKNFFDLKIFKLKKKTQKMVKQNQNFVNLTYIIMTNLSLLKKREELKMFFFFVDC